MTALLFAALAGVMTAVAFPELGFWRRLALIVAMVCFAHAAVVS